MTIQSFSRTSIRFSTALPLTFALLVSTLSPVIAQRTDVLSEQKPVVRPGNDPQHDDKKSNPFSAEESTIENRKWGVVLANGQAIMGIPIEAGGYTRLQRAQHIAERMSKLYMSGAKFKQTDGYAVGTLDGETVLCLRTAQDPQKYELLVTIDSNLQKMLHSTRKDIAFYWRDMLLKGLANQDQITATMQDSNAWAKIPSNYAADKKEIPLRDKDVHRIKN